jgi:O-antigen/teichoic acid export membrane protein
MASSRSGIANLLANVFIILIFVNEYRLIASAYNPDRYKLLLKYGWPLMLMGFAGMVNEVLDRILLERWLPDNFYPGQSTAAMVGIYSGCYKLAILITLGIQAFRYAVEPYFFKEFKSDDAQIKYSKVMHLYLISACLAMLFIEVNIDLLKVLLRRPEYYIGLQIVPFLLLANVLLGVFFNLSAWYKLKDQTKAGTILTMIGALVTIFANLLLIPLLGIVGAAVSTLLCYATMVLISYLWGQSVYKIPYQLKKGLLYLLLSAALTFILAFWPFDYAHGRLMIGWPALFLFTTLIFVIEKPFSKRSLN